MALVEAAIPYTVYLLKNCGWWSFPFSLKFYFSSKIGKVAFFVPIILSLPPACRRAKLLKTEIDGRFLPHLSYLLLWCYSMLLGVTFLTFFLTNVLKKFFDEIFWQIFLTIYFDEFFWRNYWRIFLTYFLTIFFWRYVWRFF